MDEGAHVVTGEDQRLTGHTGALLCLALLDKRLLFSSSTDLTIKACLLQELLPLDADSYLWRFAVAYIASTWIWANTVTFCCDLRAR